MLDRKIRSCASNSKFVLTVMLALVTALNSCPGQETLTDKYFVGKWKSSRVTAPVYLYENGEWETEVGGVQHYGVWLYKNNKIMWSYKFDNGIGHDINEIVSATSGEFKLRESDNSIVTFSRLN